MGAELSKKSMSQSNGNNEPDPMHSKKEQSVFFLKEVGMDVTKNIPEPSQVHQRIKKEEEHKHVLREESNTEYSRMRRSALPFPIALKPTKGTQSEMKNEVYEGESIFGLASIRSTNYEDVMESRHGISTIEEPLKKYVDNKVDEAVIKIISEMNEKISQLGQKLKDLESKSGELDVRIDKVDIHNPVLENLTFRLDQLDIKELSGALNLGNNFGVRVEQSKKSKLGSGQNEEQSGGGSQSREHSSGGNRNSQMSSIEKIPGFITSMAAEE